MSRSQKNTDSSVFIDANVLLEIVLSRKHEQVARKALEDFAGCSLYISGLTGHLVVHFGRKRANLSALRAFLSDYVILPLDMQDFVWAFDNIRDDDFEDALQLAVAIRNNCEIFVTFDKPLHKAYQTLPNLRLQLL